MKPNETPVKGDVLLTCSVGGEIEDEPAEVLGIAASGWIVLQTPRARPAPTAPMPVIDRNYGVVTLFRQRPYLHRVPGG